MQVKGRIAGLCAVLLLWTSVADADSGSHVVEVAGTAPNTDNMRANMMIPHKPKRCKGECFVGAYITLRSGCDTSEQFASAGIGYHPNSSSSKPVLFWFSEQDWEVNAVVEVPWGAWVHVILEKPLGEERVRATWRLDDGTQFEQWIATPRWRGNTAHHPVAVNVYTPNKKHPQNVEVYVSDALSWPEDDLRWRVDGPWGPEGDFHSFVVK